LRRNPSHSIRHIDTAHHIMNTPIAQAVNPFAGWHPIASTPEEMEAAHRATERSLREHPYYLARFGERGRLFGGSDGGWLVSLCRGEPEFVERQVLWLGHVLASRGMPRRLLQRHLEILHDELLRTLPPNGYPALLGAAERLRAAQEPHLPEADARALAAGFDAAADPEWVARLPDMGRILAAAVADEAAGIAGAATSVEEWAADGRRFPERWVGAVGRTLASARETVHIRRLP
jgi:hypothetical protein